MGGEYALLQAGKMLELLIMKKVMETLLSIKRAGADLIITYHAKKKLKILKDNLS